ncbi:MAG: LytTR family DNA-binding domain-containing protein [Flavobacteriaceae bacterium]|nr:LytTR family DNA-binding domain-containing protein [Flavobacteriaceae bacterium]
MKIRSVILDDEQHCIDTLKWQLEKYCIEVDVVASFNSPNLALEYVKTNKIDLVFLDIEMPEMNGFEFLKNIQNISLEVIFTTAYDEFALKAFQASAIDYLLKPIDKEGLVSAVKKMQEKKKPNLLPEQMEILYDSLNTKKHIKERIAVPTQEGLYFVKIKEIMYCISDSNYTNIHLINNKKLLVSRTLKEIELMLEGSGFLRIHHSYLINLQKIEKYIRGDGGYVVMDDKKSLSVSRSRKEALLTIFE